MFVWDKIIGFVVVGSAQDQKITDDRLHDEKISREEAEQKGELWAALDQARQKLRDTTSLMSRTWLQFYDARRKRESETSLLAQRHEAELRRIEAQITDDQKALNSHIQSILGEFKELFSPKASAHG